MQNLFNLMLEFKKNKSNFEVDPRYGFLEFCFKNVHLSKAQVFQDMFVLYILKEKRNGFFVEFGATDGIYLSNTFMLEKHYGWSGCLAEPCKSWHASYTRPVRQCVVDFRCITDRTGENIEFSQSSMGELSAMTQFIDRYGDGDKRGSDKYLVETVSLNDFLLQHNAPVDIDYLTVDTEGSEQMILDAFDFTKYRIKIITVEHNHLNPDRENIFNLLSSNGYIRVFESFSQIDDWYVNPNYCQIIRGLC